MSEEILYTIILEDYSDSDGLVPELLGIFECDFSSFEDRENRKFLHTLYFPTADERDEMVDQVKAAVKEWKEFGADLEFCGIDEVRKSEWAEAWKKYFKPIEISERLLIRPSWIDAPAKEGQKILTLDPGMSFGTGQHATTLFCLKMIDRFSTDPEVKSVLDAGCGSGILAIAAGLLGYDKVDAFDFDPDAVRVAKENLEINNVSNIVPTVGDAAEYAGDPEKYDLVCANILGHLLIAFSGNISTWVKDGKYLSLAGILNQDFDAVSRCYCEKGFEEIERFTLKEWTSGLFRKVR
jgi:ribosomal protein L11 methyltransferase